MQLPEIDTCRIEAFAGQMLGVLNHATLALMVSIGHQTGLFDVLAGLPPATSAAIADAARLNERYVREWLGALVTGRVIDYEPIGQTYHLPPAHAVVLTRAAGSDNLAMFMRCIALVGNVEQSVIEAFRKGGGVSAAAFPRLAALLADDNAAHCDANLIERILPLAPGLTDRLQAGADVADLGCGRGHALLLMARAFPRSRFYGYDLDEDGVAAGRAAATRQRLDNARFEVADVATLSGPPRFDLISAFDVIHDLARPATVLRGAVEALRPDGTFLMAEVAASSHLHENLDHPLAPALYSFSAMHCLTVSLARGGEGLGAMWGEQQARAMLAAAGLAALAVHRLPGDIRRNYYVARRG